MSIRARSHFADVKSANTGLYKDKQRRLSKDAAFKIYQQNPDPAKEFLYQGSIIWDIEEAEPTDVFGVSLEAFDPIRQQQKCHIVYEEDSEALKILTTKKTYLDGAVSRIQSAIAGKPIKTFSPYTSPVTRLVKVSFLGISWWISS